MGRREEALYRHLRAGALREGVRAGLRLRMSGLRDAVRGGRARLALRGGLAQVRWDVGVGRRRHACSAARDDIRKGALSGVVVDGRAPLRRTLRARSRDGLLQVEMVVGGSEEVVVGDSGCHRLDEGVELGRDEGRGKGVQCPHLYILVDLKSRVWEEDGGRRWEKGEGRGPLLLLLFAFPSLTSAAACGNQTLIA